nr:uridylyl transferase [Pseudomonas aeruginosa PAO1]
MPQVDPELFDRGQFQAELALKSSPIAAFKKAIRQFREVLDNRFNSGRDIRRLIEDRAWCVDQILQQAWQRFDWGDDADIALVAVGGYGRGELHPYSDVDLLILLDSEDQESFREPIEGFLTLLWDIGLEVGQSVRSVQQCAEEARADLTVITTLMECRTICGPDSLRQRMLQVTGSAHMWPSKEFFLAKRHEQQRRHAKYNDTEYNLEPNVKGSPGGLRDIQTILWMARRQFGSLNLHALVREGFLVESECSMLASSQEFLWRVRYALHMLAGRAEDRLLFDHQSQHRPSVRLRRQRRQTGGRTLHAEVLPGGDGDLRAERPDHPALRGSHPALRAAGADPAAEQSLPVARRLHRGDAPERLQAHSVRPPGNLRADGPAPGNQGRARRHHSPAARQPTPDRRRVPPRHPQHQPVHRAVQEQPGYPPQPAADEPLRHPRPLPAGVRPYHRADAARPVPYLYGGRPHPQPDQAPAQAESAGDGREISAGEQDHRSSAQAGTDLHRRSLPRHRQGPWRRPLGTRRGGRRGLLPEPPVAALGHPTGVLAGAEPPGDVDHRATQGPLRPAGDLRFRPTGRRPDPPRLPVRAHRGRHQRHQPDALELLARQPAPAALHRDQARPAPRPGEPGGPRGADPPDADRGPRPTGTQRHRPGRCRAVMEPARRRLLPAPHRRRRGLAHRGDPPAPGRRHAAGADQGNHPARVRERFADLHLRRRPARFLRGHRGRHGPAQPEHPGRADHHLHQPVHPRYLYRARADGDSIGNNPERIAEIREGLIDALKNPDDYPTIIQRRVPRQLKHFAFAPQVTISTDAVRQVSVLEVIAPDRPGLLARIGGIFLDFDLSVQNAKIATLGERVEDVFYITDARNQPLADPDLCKRLQAALVEQLSQDNGRDTLPTRINF